MNILGLSFDYHDSAAAIIQNGIVVAAAQEERFVRIKNTSRFPEESISFCLEKAGLSLSDIDHVVYYEEPLVKFDRIFKAASFNAPDSKDYFKTVLRTWAVEGKFMVLPRISRYLKMPFWKIHTVSHHDSHSGAAYLCSPFDKATVITIDGVGEYETMTISVGKGNSIKKIKSMSLPNSLGLFYSAFTAFLGFEVNEGEYKVMGMAGFGKPVYFDQMIKLFKFNSDGTFILDQKMFNFLCPEESMYNKNLCDVYGPAREPNSDFYIDGDDANEQVKKNRYYADIAASVQKCTEEVILRTVESAVKNTGIENVCMAGGVALNSLANGRIRKEKGYQLFIHPAAGDAGSAIGAALYYNHCVLKKKRQKAFTTPFLGKDYSDDEIVRAIKESFNTNYVKYDSKESLLEEVANILSEGAIVGWLQGRFEWGPRALGSRSILANPTIKDIQRIVNEKIKFRELFRPFAPSVLEEEAENYFEVPTIQSNLDPEYLMASICKTRSDKAHTIPAVTHVDGTARVQIVTKDTNPVFHDLIKAFSRKSGVPVLLNTSFNLKGEPVVNTPHNAIRTFEWSDMDYLVLENYLIKKDRA